MNAFIITRSQSANVFWAKFWLPLLFTIPGIGILVEDFPTWRILFALPFFIIALFHMSVAVLEVRDGDIRYKRLLTWERIQYCEIKSAGVAWHHFIGYVRLNRFVFPWGRLFFALDADLNPNPFRPADYASLRCLRKEPLPQELVSVTPLGGRILVLNLRSGGILGVLLAIALRIVVPRPSHGSVLEQPLNIGKHIWIDTLIRINHLVTTFPALFGFLVLFVLLATYRYRKPDSWIFAFLVGLLLPYLLFH